MTGNLHSPFGFLSRSFTICLVCLCLSGNIQAQDTVIDTFTTVPANCVGFKVIPKTIYEQTPVKLKKWITETSMVQKDVVVEKLVYETQMREASVVVKKPVTQELIQTENVQALRPVNVQATTWVPAELSYSQWQAISPRPRMQWLDSGYYTDPTTGLSVFRRRGFHWVGQGTSYQLQTTTAPIWAPQQNNAVAYIPETIQTKKPIQVTKMVDTVVRRKIPVQVQVKKSFTETKSVPKNSGRWVEVDAIKNTPKTIYLRVPVDAAGNVIGEIPDIKSLNPTSSPPLPTPESTRNSDDLFPKPTQTNKDLIETADRSGLKSVLEKSTSSKEDSGEQEEASEKEVRQFHTKPTLAERNRGWQPLSRNPVTGMTIAKSRSSILEAPANTVETSKRVEKDDIESTLEAGLPKADEPEQESKGIDAARSTGVNDTNEDTANETETDSELEPSEPEADSDTDPEVETDSENEEVDELGDQSSEEV